MITVIVTHNNYFQISKFKIHFGGKKTRDILGLGKIVPPPSLCISVVIQK